MIEDRRESPRANAFTFGAILVADGAEPTECLVWDLSDVGARIEVEAPDALPERFSLSTHPEAQPRAVRVVRRDGRRIGVVFA